MKISHFFATSIVAILALTDHSASATYVNQIENDRFETESPIVLTQNEAEIDDYKTEAELNAAARRHV